MSSNISKQELLDALDDIANKPWRAIRYIAELFETSRSENSEWFDEVAFEYRKLEAFYSNGGRKKIDELLADPSFNVNNPELRKQSILVWI